MKTLTKNLLRYAIAALLLTIAFRYFLTAALEARRFTQVMVIAILYGISMFTSGWYLGKKDHKDLDLQDVGFRFHLATYVIFVLISELWFLLGFNSSHEQIGSVHITAFIWGIGLLIHGFIYLKTRKNTIDGLDKSELFE